MHTGLIDAELRILARRMLAVYRRHGQDAVDAKFSHYAPNSESRGFSLSESDWTLVQTLYQSHKQVSEEESN